MRCSYREIQDTKKQWQRTSGTFAFSSWRGSNARIHAGRYVRHEGGRVIAVGTTSVRALEAASASGNLKAFDGDTDLFVVPGFRFNCVDAMITNFHLPKSSLLMLVSAFAGTKCMLDAYRHAVNERYRFFSYGDAMFIS